MTNYKYAFIGTGIIMFALLVIIFASDFIQIVRFGLSGFFAQKELTSVLNRAIEQRDISICEELPKTRKTLTSDGEIDSTGARGTIDDCKQQFNNKVTLKPEIIYPTNGIAFNNQNLILKGKTNPNFNIYAYINYPNQDRNCISINSYANGGAGKSDQNGDFEFKLAEPCSKVMDVFVAAVNPEKESNEHCWNENNISKSINFTNNNEIPDFCNK